MSDLEIYKKLLPYSDITIKKGNPIKIYVKVSKELVEAYKEAVRKYYNAIS